jgi:hypothetical protein
MKRFMSCIALVCSILPLATSHAEAAPQTYVTVFSPVDNVVGEWINTNTLTTFDGAAVDVLADFNVLSVTITAAESSGTGAWRDEWTVNGGSGAGTMIVHWRLDGTLAIGSRPGCVDCDVNRVRLASLFGSSGVTSFGAEIASVVNNTGATQAVHSTGTLIVPFTFGAQFGAGLRLSGSTDDDFYGGGVSFPNGAVITGIELPVGASLTTNSGRAYPVAAQSPADVIAALALAAADAGLLQAQRLLQNALAGLERGDGPDACGQLTAVVNLVQALAGRQLSVADANSLIASATGVVQTLGCR